MKPLDVSANLTDRVYQAILDEILEGRLRAGEHLVQETLAKTLGVSRQPIQQAMALLKSDGVVVEVGRRGLAVAPIDTNRMKHHYELRGVLDGHGTRRAAHAVDAKPVLARDLADRADAIFAATEVAIAEGSIAEIIRQDEAFHKTLYDISGNSVLAEVAEPTWRFVRRAMAEFARRAKPPQDILAEHREILAAVLAGDGDQADALSRAHTASAADWLLGLAGETPSEDAA